MSTIPETHYARSSDGTNIAYQVLGEGARDLVWYAGLLSNVEAQWDMPEFASFFRRVARFSRLILFDRRGAGASTRCPAYRSHPSR